MSRLVCYSLKRLEDMLFIFIVVLSILFSYFIYGLNGLAILTVAFFLPLYIIRIIIWSFWFWLRPWLLVNLTSRAWNILLFSIWGSIAIFIWLLAPNLLLRHKDISLPAWIQTLGFVLAIGGVVIGLWSEWLLGLQTAILTTRIFDKDSKEEQKIITTGPYALFPHPIFLSEWLIISGCFLFTSQTYLLILLVVALLTDMFAAKGEEKDLRIRFSKGYQNYRSKFFIFCQKKEK